MSYEDLWDSFHDVKKYWLDNKQTFEAYLELIKYHWTIGKKNIKYFEKLQTFNFFKLTKGSLQPISEKIKTFYSEQVSIYKNFTESLQNSVIQSIRDTLTNQEQTFKETTEKCKKLENDQKKLKKNLESSKEKYFKCCRETLLATKNKADYITKEAQSLETYIKSIDTLNRFDMTFIEEMRKNMQIYQMTESSRFESLYDSMNKFHEFFISLSSQSLPLLESLSPVIAN
jgi:DNA-binding ferritin-like protein